MKNLVLVIGFMWLVACNNQIETDYAVVEQSGQTTNQYDNLLNDYRLITEIGSLFLCHRSNLYPARENG